MQTICLTSSRDGDGRALPHRFHPARLQKTEVFTNEYFGTSSEYLIRTPLLLYNMVSNPWKEPICTVLKLTGQCLFPTRIALLCKQAGAVIPQSQMQEYSHHPLPRIESGVVRGTETQRKCLGGKGFLPDMGRWPYQAACATFGGYVTLREAQAG